MNRNLTIGVVIIILVLLAGGFLWLANSNMMPPTHAVEQAIPDDHIPR
jgi:hypothetical protein